MTAKTLVLQEENTIIIVETDQTIDHLDVLDMVMTAIYTHWDTELLQDDRKICLLQKGNQLHLVYEHVSII